MTIPCKIGCGKQINYELIQFSDGFVYRYPHELDGMIHICPIYADPKNWYLPEMDQNKNKENSFGWEYLEMDNHLVSFFDEYEKTPNEKIIHKWKNVIQSDMNSFPAPSVDFTIPHNSEFCSQQHFIILGKIYEKLELIDDALFCYGIQFDIFDKLKSDGNEEHIPWLKSQIAELTPLYENCVRKSNIKKESYDLINATAKKIMKEMKLLISQDPEVKKEAKRRAESEIKLQKSKSEDGEVASNTVKNDSRSSEKEYSKHTQIHLAKLEMNLRKFILKIYDNDIRFILNNFPQMLEHITEQQKKHEKLLYDTKETNELEKITFGQLIKILENKHTRKKVMDHGITNLDDVIFHLTMTSKYRNQLDHSKGLVDGDLPRDHKNLVISNCRILNQFFEKNDLT
jgi:hypothetical protein